MKKRLLHSLALACVCLVPCTWNSYAQTTSDFTHNPLNARNPQSVTTWDGTSWSDGAPDYTKDAVITGNFTSTGSLEALSLTVDNDATVNILSGHSLTLADALTVHSGSFTLANNAALIQTANVANTGSIVVQRNSSALQRQDYTLWSAPVAGQNLLDFSPLTLTNRFYTYNTTSNLYSTIAPAANSFEAAAGYLVRMPNSHPATATVWNGQFTGVPNNGDVNYVMSNTYNLTGNPYPSPISMASFVADNADAITGTLYFWRETNGSTSNNAYCSWTGGTFTSNNEAQVVKPSGVIQTGQGFFVVAKPGQTALSFKNSQRLSDTNNQFFRVTDLDEERHTLWLNATNSQGAFSQMAVGYITGATMGVDMYDGMAFPDGEMALGSWLDNENYVIQGRPVPFDVTDVVPLTFRCTNAGTYTITLDHVIGLFEGSQQIFLKDRFTNSLHNLKVSGYQFETASGAFNARFEIVYQQLLQLGSQDVFKADSVVVYKQGDELVIDSGNVPLQHVAVYDLRGRLLAQQSVLNATATRLYLGTTHEVLVVKLTSFQQQTYTRKIVD